MSQQNTIYEDLVFRDAQATAGLARVGEKVGLLSRAIGGVKNALGGTTGALGLAGLFGVAHTIGGLNELYAKIRRLKAVAGVTAAEGHALTDAFELTGAAEISEQVITRLARLGQRAGGAGKEASKLNAQLAHTGVDMKHGVTEALLSMSTAVTKGKLGIADMSKTFKIPLAQSATLMASLGQGPAKMRAIMADTLGGADLVDDAALASYEKMQQGKRELSDAWEGLVGTIYKQLLPGVTTVVNALTKGLAWAQPIVSAIGSLLAKHMDLVVASAKAYLGYLIAAKAVSMTTGGTLGGLIKGRLGSILGGGGPAPAMFQAGRQLPGAARAISSLNIGSQFAGRGALAGVGNSIAQIANRFSPMLGKLLSSAVSFRTLLSVIGRFMLIGGVIMVAVRVFSMLKNDVGGFRTRIGAVLGEIVDKFRGIGAVIKPVLGLLTYVFGKVLTGIGYVVLGIFEGVLRAIGFTLTILRAVVNVMATLITSPWWSIRHPVKLFTNAWADASKTTEHLVGGKKTTEGKGTGKTPPTNYQDFRGSTFNIKNEFAEGFDIGRVSVAVGEGIAAAAQRRLMSGFAPTFAVRGGM